MKIGQKFWKNRKIILKNFILGMEIGTFFDLLLLVGYGIWKYTT